MYVLENPAGRFYVGSTEDVQRRVQQHNDQSVESSFKYTRARGPWIIRWTESHPSRASAVRRERQIKSMKSARWIREQLLNGRVPACRD
ncbi:MAG: GIY-YIG nuclease family protein [Phycisphaerae bacterium]